MSGNPCQGEAGASQGGGAQIWWGRLARDLPSREREGLLDPLCLDLYSFYFCDSNLGQEESLGEKWKGRKEDQGEAS